MKRKYTKRKPATKVSSAFKFEISSDWSPKKASTNHEFLDAIVNTALTLLSKESFPVAMTDLTKLCGYANGGSAASCIRAAIKKRVGKTKIGEYGCHVVKDHAGKAVAVRVRKK